MPDSLHADLIAFAPLTPDTPRVDLFLSYARLRVNRKAWGAKSDMATILIALHMLTRFDADTGAAVGGSVIGEKVGDLETRYAAVNIKGDEDFSTTSYGTLYVQMRTGLGLTPRMV